MPTTVRSFCKINLGLAVGAARPDGFHALSTLYQTLALHDLVTVTARHAAHTSITLEVNHPGVPCTATGDDARNTAWRIVDGALTRLGRSAAVHITLDKRLPVQGGLGAGSANAAAALLGLERELGCALPGPERLTLAAWVGSDVPLFLLGGTVLGLHRGEAVYPLPDLPASPVVVAVPSVGVSTAQAFRDLDARTPARQEPGQDNGGRSEPDGSPKLSSPDLTTVAAFDKVEELSRVLASAWTSTGAERAPTGIASSSLTPSGMGAPYQREAPGSSPRGDVDGLAGNPLLALVRAGVENDFEDVAFQQHPSLRNIKRALSGSPGNSSGALYAALSGSGSALFGIYGDLQAAHEAQQRVQSCGTRAFLTETLSREEFWRRTFV